MDKKMGQYRHKIRCAFCENDADTEEHYLGQWHDNFLEPRSETDRHTKTRRKISAGGGKTPTTSEMEIFIKNGNARKIHKKIVCKLCNSGWMSTIQNNAIPVLTKMIQDKDFSINEEDRFNIARWATMVSMTFEYDHPETQAIPRYQREAFKNTMTPESDDWLIWAGMHVGKEWKSRVLHQGGCMFEDRKTIMENNWQSTIIAIEAMDLLVISSTSYLFKGGEKTTEAASKNLVDLFGLMQVWPPIQGDIHWRSLRETLINQ